MNYRLIPALFLIVLGALFLLDNLGLAHMDVGHLIATWWPMFLIAAGVHRAALPREGRRDLLKVTAAPLPQELLYVRGNVTPV